MRFLASLPRLLTVSYLFECAPVPADKRGLNEGRAHVVWRSCLADHAEGSTGRRLMAPVATDHNTDHPYQTHRLLMFDTQDKAVTILLW